MCCILTIFNHGSVFALRCVGLLFFLCSSFSVLCVCVSVCVCVLAVVRSPAREAWAMSAPRLTSVWARVWLVGNHVPLLRIYQQNILLLVCGLMLYETGRGGTGGEQEAGKPSTTDTDADFHLENIKPLTRNESTDPFFSFSISPGGFLTDQIVRTRR